LGGWWIDELKGELGMKTICAMALVAVSTLAATGCWGRSESLKIDSRPKEDSVALAKQLGLST